MAERRVLFIPQFLKTNEPMDVEGATFFNEVIGRLSGALTNRPGAVSKMPAQADSTAATVSELKDDFNALLTKLRNAGMLSS